MSKHLSHATHPAIIKRLKRANGHLASVIKMIEDEQPCVDIAQQLQAVEKAVQQAKRTLIQDHIDHCLDDALVEHGESSVTAEFRAITKYL
jgi:DNA-binding FrmR family transcriptional regulator